MIGDKYNRELGNVNVLEELSKNLYSTLEKVFEKVKGANYLESVKKKLEKAKNPYEKIEIIIDAHGDLRKKEDIDTELKTVINEGTYSNLEEAYKTLLSYLKESEYKKPSKYKFGETINYLSGLLEDKIYSKLYRAFGYRDKNTYWLRRSLKLLERRFGFNPFGNIYLPRLMEAYIREGEDILKYILAENEEFREFIWSYINTTVEDLINSARLFAIASVKDMLQHKSDIDYSKLEEKIRISDDKKKDIITTFISNPAAGAAKVTREITLATQNALIEFLKDIGEGDKASTIVVPIINKMSSDVIQQITQKTEEEFKSIWNMTVGLAINVVKVPLESIRKEKIERELGITTEEKPIEKEKRKGILSKIGSALRKIPEYLYGYKEK